MTPARKAVKKAARKSAKKTAIQAGKKPAQKPAQKTAKQAAKKSARPAARIGRRAKSGARVKAGTKSAARAKVSAKTGAGEFLPLAGVRVLDLTKVLAGPLCTQYLADMGAEVIKVEPVEGGDDTRAWEPQIGNNGAFFMAANRNKKSLALDLKRPEAQAIVRRLAAGADLFVESYGTGVVERLGAGYETIRRVNPGIIYLSVSGYGRDGPLAHLPGYDAMLQAFSGIMGLTGEPDSGPVRIGFSPLDQATGINGAFAAVAALFGRNRQGAKGKRRGQFIEVSLFETAVGLLGYLAQIYWASGRLPVRGGSGFEYLCPYQAFAAADGDLMLGLASDNLWRKFCLLVGIPHLADDPRFRTNSDRLKHRAETVALVADIIRTKTKGDWFEILANAGIPASPINSVDQVLVHPHTLARGMIMDYAHPKLGPLRAVGLPVKAAGSKQTVHIAPPALGQHSREILGALGFAKGRIDGLIRAGVVGAAD